MTPFWESTVTLIVAGVARVPGYAVVQTHDADALHVQMRVLLDGHVQHIAAGDLILVVTPNNRAAQAAVRFVEGADNATTGEHRTVIEADVQPFPWPAVASDIR